MSSFWLSMSIHIYHICIFLSSEIPKFQKVLLNLFFFFFFFWLLPIVISQKLSDHITSTSEKSRAWTIETGPKKKKKKQKKKVLQYNAFDDTITIAAASSWTAGAEEAKGGVPRQRHDDCAASPFGHQAQRQCAACGRYGPAYKDPRTSARPASRRGAYDHYPGDHRPQNSAGLGARL